VPLETPIVKRAFDRLGNDFVVGLTSQLDVSVLLFERALGLSRSDTLYSLESMTEFDPKNHPAVRRLVEAPLKEDWNGERRRERLISTMSKLASPLQFHLSLFEAGVKLHQRQVATYIGSADTVQASLDVYKSQVAEFTKCFEVLRKLPPKPGQQGFGSCPATEGGSGGGISAAENLYAASSARRACTARQRQFYSPATPASYPRHALA